jgi:hypothetical protein
VVPTIARGTVWFNRQTNRTRNGETAIRFSPGTKWTVWRLHGQLVRPAWGMIQSDMRRIVLTILLLAVGGLGIVGVHSWFEKQSRRKREAAYDSILRSYTQALKPGMTRKQVEDYLRAKNVSFQQMSGINGDSWDDLIKIGQEEEHPWYCSEHIVYLAFQFADYEQPGKHLDLGANKLDTLRAVTIYHKLEGCL